MKKNNALTKEQIDFIEANYKTVMVKEMARRWGMNPYKIYEHMKKNNLQSPHKRAVHRQSSIRTGFFTDKHFKKYSII